MAEHASSSPARSDNDPDDPLARAAAAGPLPGAEIAADGAPAENAEPAAAHDSPAGIDEARASDPGADGDELVGTDPLSTIYGPPPGDRE